MNAEWCVLLPVRRIVPGAGWQMHHAGVYVLGQHRRRETGATIVEQPDDVTLCDAARCCIGGMQPGDLPTAVLAGLAVFAEVRLAVQPPRRLIGDQPQRVPLVGNVGGCQPDRVTGAVRIAKAGLDPFSTEAAAA